MVTVVVCHFPVRNALASSRWNAEHCGHVRTLTADVMSRNRHTGICFLVYFVLWLLEVIVYSVPSPIDCLT